MTTPDQGPITVETSYPGQSVTISFDVEKTITRTAVNEPGKTQTYTICIGNGCGLSNGAGAISSASDVGSELSTGSIVGIVIGCAIGILLFGTGIWFLVKARQKQKPSHNNSVSDPRNFQVHTSERSSQPNQPVRTAHWSAPSRPGVRRVDDNGRALRD